MPVNTSRDDYKAAMPKWKRCRDCAEGSDSVKAAATLYLPALDSHKASPLKYEEYTLRALFYNATGRTVEGLAGSIFQKAPKIELPERIKLHVDDITMTGVSAELFALRTTREILTTGRYGLLVEMPNEASADQRPYWCGYRAEDIVNWQTKRILGDSVLTRVVLCEHEEIPSPKDPFVDICVVQYRVLELKVDGASRIYTSTVWRKPEETKEFVPGETEIPMRRGVALDFIPFVFIGPTSTSPDVEKPPLLDLVDVNLSHYRTSADLEHGRHWTALPTPWVAGAMGSKDGPLSIGSGVAWELEKDGSAGMLEFTGQGLGALESADNGKRKMMATLGARLLEEQASSAETASAVGMRHSGEHATLRTIAQAVEQALTLAARIHTWWMGGEKKPQDAKASIELNKEFFAVKASPDEVRAALLALQADAISFTTFYERLQKGGWTREGVTAEEEKAEIDRQGSIDREQRQKDIDDGLLPPGPGTPPGAPPAPPAGGPPAPPAPPKPPAAGGA